MSKYSTPGIGFTEIDNTIRSNSIPGLGIGAIVLKSNKGPVNQRFLTSSFDDFTQVYGEPENLDDYGHFAAENYLSISNQLLCVRATMGDEGYAQIQFPYTDADVNDKFTSRDTAEFKFINNEDNSQLKLLSPLDTVTTVTALTEGKEWIVPDSTLSSFYLNQRAQFATIEDLITDAPPSVAVFKAVGDDSIEEDGVIAGSGKYIKFVSKVSNKGEALKYFDDLILTSGAWDEGTLNSDAFSFNSTPITNIYYDDATSSTLTAYGYKTTFSIPATDTLNESPCSLTAYFTKDFKDAVEASSAQDIPYSGIFKSENFYTGDDSDNSEFCETSGAYKLQYRDWDDGTTKTSYVEESSFTNTRGQAGGIQFREYGFSTPQEALIGGMDGDISDADIVVKKVTEIVTDTTVKSVYGNRTGRDFIMSLADEYGADYEEIVSDKYSVLFYYDVWEGKQIGGGSNQAKSSNISNEYTIKLIYTDEWEQFNALNGGKNFNEFLFWTVSEKNTNKAQSISTYVQTTPNPVVIPWQEGMGDDVIRPLVAFASSEILNSVNEKYRDGYTPTIESDDEPGNGDIEQYVSNKNNQLIIAASNPGAYGNDIGISIITTECADIPALNHQNAFNWKYRYDDEELVDADVEDLTWKKVYRVNVYVKNKTQTAEAAWGSGMEALLKDPVEFFYVSNDPTAKDRSGNSLYAPNVINGHSNYIYVSRNSVNEAKTGAGTYAQPCQTYAIYPLTGGANSKKNNVTEKIAALKLYRDRQKADFDILFNVDAIDTFNGRQRYAALQKKIAEIASSRKIDIGVVQLTSKEAKTAKRQIGEAKMFAFNEPSYVAPYGGYDKYYNATLGSWIYLPKSIAGACAMAYCDMYAHPWMAPAGVARGKIDYTAGQLTRLTDDEIGQLYDVNVNTSRQCGGFGEILWAQKTAVKLDSALNRINVRRCLNYIEKQLENMLVPYLFQQNLPNTRSAAKNTIDAFLSRVQAADGIVEYRLSVTEDISDPHIMNVNIRLIPAEAIEWIDVKITIDRNTGVTGIEG